MRNYFLIIRKLNLKCKFILGSTFIVIGRPDKLPVNENSICNPTTIYGTNRLASEYYCKIFNQLYDLDILIFRITNSFGPREQSLTPTKNAINFLIHHAFKGKEITIYNQGKFFRDVIYIDDVISALNVLMNKGKKGESYNISASNEIDVLTIIKKILSIMNKDISNYELSEDRPGHDFRYSMSSKKISNELGWIMKTSFEEGLEKTIQWYLDNPDILNEISSTVLDSTPWKSSNKL